MKKTNPIIITALLAVAALMTGCSKAEDTASEALKQGEATLARIMDFKKQMKEAKANPGMKTTSYMSIDDAVWNVEALFNFTYAYPEEMYSNTISCDTALNLYVCANDSVLLTDLSVFYGQMFDAVQTIYQSVDLNNKEFLILDVEAGERNGSLQAIELHTVQGSVRGEQPGPDTPHSWEPFEGNVLWYYGEGHENSMGITVDAADTLSRMLNALLVPKAPSGLTYIYTNIITKELDAWDHCEYSHNSYPGCGPYCEFYKENPSPADFWLNSDQMNFHYFGERYLVNVYLRTYKSLIPSTHYLINVAISDNETAAKIWHHTQAAYGHREGISKNEIIKGNL